MSYFDPRFGHIIAPETFGAAQESHLMALEKDNLLGYGIIDQLLKSGMETWEIPQPNKDFYLSAQRRSQMMLAEWHRLHWILNRKEIDTVPLHAIWQMERFPQRTLLGDELEILLSPISYERACGLLLTCGYEELGASGARPKLGSSFRNPELDLVVELHTSLGSNDFHRIPTNDLWNRRVQWKEGHYELSPLDQVVFTFHHAALHYFDRPARILDLHYVWQWAEQKVELKDVVERARVWRCAKTLLLSLEAYSDFVKVPFHGLFTDSERNTVRKVWDMIFLKGQRDPLLRWQLSDNLTDAVRGTLHPNRILRIFDAGGDAF